ncbi:hypothetical protein B4077_2593 [Bacillus cereus]|uniref:Uncharacterized protein n=1 Tax=Bacillus cereus TaxID=1396 RepID=A0A0G8F5M7_BACCE|nr:hypothetical protein B4077_2593 [Bacillus cereus]
MILKNKKSPYLKAIHNLFIRDYINKQQDSNVRRVSLKINK